MLKYKVIGRCQVHDSFLGDLLDRKETLRLESAMQQLLNKENGEESERIIQMAWVDVAAEEESTKPTFTAAFSQPEEHGPRLLGLTNKRVIIMGQSRHGTDKRPCGLCPPESFCPVGPDFESAFPLTELTRIICNSDPQLLIIGHVKRSFTGQLVGEEFLKVIFNQRDARAEFKERLSTLSGTSVSNRIPPTADMVVGKCVKKKTTSRIVCTTWAFREMEEGERLSYFVLTELNFFEFKADFSNWLPGSENNIEYYASEDDYQGGESDNDDMMNTVHVGEGPSQKSQFSQKCLKAMKSQRSELFVHERRDREEPWLGERALERGKRRYQPPPNEWLIEGLGINTHGAGCETIWDELSKSEIKTALEDRVKAISITEQKYFQIHGAPKEEQAMHSRKVIKNAQRMIVAQEFKCPIINLKEVSFEHGEQPIVHLKFQAGKDLETLIIRFMDDATRERWRRYLQFIIFKQSDSNTEWTRGNASHDLPPPADGKAPNPRKTASAKFFGGK